MAVNMFFPFFENALGGAKQFVKRRIDEEISSVLRYLRVVLRYWVDLIR